MAGTNWSLKAGQPTEIVALEGMAVNGGSGIDQVTINADGTVVDAKAGQDRILMNSGSNVSISGGAGKDFITLKGGSNITVNGGATGDEIINLGATNVVYQYDASGGKDTISGFTSSDTLVFGSNVRLATNAPTNNGQDITFLTNNSSHQVLLKDVAPGTTLHWQTSDGAVHESVLPMILYGKTNVNNTDLSNTQRAVTIIGGAKNDTITNTGISASIMAGAGKDSIYNKSAQTTINAGAGDDTIIEDSGYSNYDWIDGGAGDDVISLVGGDNVKVIGGADDDLIIKDAANNYRVTYIYYNDDGNDTIYGFDPDKDELGFVGEIINRVAQPITVTHEQKGQDLIFYYENTTVTLKDIPAGSKIHCNLNGILEYVTLPEVLYGTSGNDNIVNDRAYPIEAGAGRDTITNTASNIVIDAGDDNDLVYNGVEGEIFTGSGVSINTGAGQDTIVNYADIVTLQGGTGNDSIVNYGSTAVYQYSLGDGKDTIWGFKSEDVIQLSDCSVTNSVISGNDIILTIGGGSADSVVLTLKDVETGADIIFADAEGEYVGTSRVYAAVDITSGMNPYENYDDEVIIRGVSSTRDTIWNYGNDVEINSGAGDDSIENSGQHVKILLGAGADTIYNSSGEPLTAEIDFEYMRDNPTTILGEAGNDFIENWQRFTKIDGGADNDIVLNYAGYVSINGGAGLDSIETWNGGTSINAGAGNDTIRIADYQWLDGGGSTYIDYAKNDGNDIIYGFGTSDILTLIDTSTLAEANVTRKGKDVFINVNGTANTITLKDYGRQQLKIYGATPEGASAAALLYNKFVATTDVTVNGTAQADKIMNTDIDFDDGYYINAGNGNDTVENYAADVTVNGGAGNDYIANSYEGAVAYQYYMKENDGTALRNEEAFSWQVNNKRYGLAASINGGAGNDTIVNYGFGILAGKKYIRLKDDYYNYDDDDSGESYYETITATDDKYVVLMGDANDDYIYNAGNNVSILGGAGNDTIVNEAIDIDSTTGKVIIDGGAGHDLMISRIHEGTQLAMEDSENYAAPEEATNYIVYQFGASGGNDTIRGFNERDYIDITSGSLRSAVAEGNNVKLTFTTGTTALLEDFVGKRITYDYYDNTGAANEASTIVSAAVSLTAFDDTYYNRDDYVLINGGAGSDQIQSTGMYVTIDGGTGRDSINAGVEPNYEWDGVSEVELSINGGAGNDIIYSYGNDIVVDGGIGHDFVQFADVDGGTIRGGKGNDTIQAEEENANVVIQYASGDGRDVIYNYQEDYSLQIMSGTVSDVLTRNSDTVIKIGGGSITLKDYIGDMTLIDANGDEIDYSELGDILDEDLFAKFEARLADISEIPADNYSAGKFEPTDYTSLAQDNNYLAYSSEKDK